MSGALDCIVIGNPEYDVQERLLTSDPISQTCCRRQYIRHGRQAFFYNDFFSHLKSADSGGMEHGYRKGDLTIHEIPPYPAIFLANYLNKRGIRTESVAHFNGGTDRLAGLLRQNPKVAVICAGATSNSLPVIKIVKFIRSINKDVRIVASGNYIYNKWATSEQEEWEKTMRVVNADFYVVHIPGEQTVYGLLRCMKEEEDYRHLGNLFMLEGGSIAFNGLQSMESDLNSYHIDWDGPDAQSLGPIVALNTSKGCPYRCSFCNFPVKNSRFQTSSVETVETQLRQLERKGVRYILFNDDTFNVPQERFKNLCRMMIRNRFSFHWFCYFRLRECDEEMIRLMKESGCSGVFLGLESADDNILDNMNKSARVKDFKRGLEWLNRYGLVSFAFFLVGFPGETEETVRRLVEFIDTSGITFYTSNLWYADTSTPVYRAKERFQLTGKDFNWKHHTMDSKEASYWTDYVFLNVKNSIWVPNENFGFQGIPYLMSKGYSLEQIKALLRDAAALVSCNLREQEADNEALISRMKHILTSVPTV